jgi:hypothetical protein
VVITRLRTLRRRWIVLVVALALVVAAIRLGDVTVPIYYYRVINDRTLVVGSTTGPWTWLRITKVSETSTSVTVEARHLSAPLPGFGDEAVELTVILRDPIGDRTLIDADTGAVVSRALCPPSLYPPYCTPNAPPTSQ